MTAKPPPWKALVDVHRAEQVRQPKQVMTPKPAWDAPAAVITKWTNEQLDAMGEEFLAGLVQATEKQDREGRGGFDDYIYLAERGYLEPLRELLPTLARNPVQAEDLKYIAARFLNLPPRAGKGDRWPRFDDVGRAVEDVKCIKALWLEHFKRRNKPPHVSATEIAATRNGVDEDQIINRMGRGKSRTKS
jgi:hypothetical protein